MFCVHFTVIVLPSPPLSEPQNILLESSLWEFGGMYEHVVNPTDWDIQNFLTLMLVHIVKNSSKLPCRCSYHLFHQLLFQLRNSWKFLWMRYTICWDCGVAISPINPVLLMGSIKATDFQFVESFLALRTSVITSQLFTCWSWNWQLLIVTINIPTLIIM